MTLVFCLTLLFQLFLGWNVWRPPLTNLSIGRAPWRSRHSSPPPNTMTQLFPQPESFFLLSPSVCVIHTILFFNLFFFCEGTDDSRLRQLLLRRQSPHVKPNSLPFFPLWTPPRLFPPVILYVPPSVCATFLIPTICLHIPCLFRPGSALIGMSFTCLSPPPQPGIFPVAAPPSLFPRSLGNFYPLRSRHPIQRVSHYPSSGFPDNA